MEGLWSRDVLKHACQLAYNLCLIGFGSVLVIQCDMTSVLKPTFPSSLEVFKHAIQQVLNSIWNEIECVAYRHTLHKFLACSLVLFSFVGYLSVTWRPFQAKQNQESIVIWWYSRSVPSIWGQHHYVSCVIITNHTMRLDWVQCKCIVHAD